ncbi:hypothetical protein DNTS_014412 [Danionella cerebrum]|uniref:Activator of Hsp90 ATPase AHSA1-like N-terminal domain-containing protein n=1 Tax=Danionella cerebrum TaxID=2873325 RepID=A0A553MXH0_9TELE|nr:hypothetical protein DNTS_014412 [Danionella translucida]
MAKWGEGDPRWIVEERADATNVNNWHWTERDVTNWSSEKLKELLVGLSVESEEGVCEITEVSKAEGEASINNRKGKLIFFYEWNLKAAWTGTSSSGIKYKGNIDVPNLSDENDVDDFDISVSLCKDEPDTTLLSLMKKEGASKIRKALANYVEVHPGHDPAHSQWHEQTEDSSGDNRNQQNSGEKKTDADTFMTSPEELYRVFLNQEMVQAFTRSGAMVEAERGGKFRLLDGNVNGEFLELVSEQKIVMKWRFNSWPCEHYATVTLTFSDKGNETELKIECRGVPENEEDRTRDGWQRYYCHAIKQTFGFGARLC